MATIAPPPVDAPTPAYWTLEDFDRAVEAGVFADRRIQLLHGELVEMPPMNDPHAAALRYLQVVFFGALGPRALSQTPIILPHDGAPEPDVAVAEPRAPARPHVDQVQLVIEVSQSSRRRDLGSKLEDYLRDGLCELWIVDLVEQCALVYRGGVLHARHPRGAGVEVVAELVPEVTLDLDAVFAAARA